MYLFPEELIINDQLLFIKEAVFIYILLQCITRL